jgi:hypothetical protein
MQYYCHILRDLGNLLVFSVQNYSTYQSYKSSLAFLLATAYSYIVTSFVFFFFVHSSLTKFTLTCTLCFVLELSKPSCVLWGVAGC